MRVRLWMASAAARSSSITVGTMLARKKPSFLAAGTRASWGAMALRAALAQMAPSLISVDSSSILSRSVARAIGGSDGSRLARIAST